MPDYQESENLLNLINILESCIPGSPILIVDDSADNLSVQIVNQIALKNIRIVTVSKNGSGEFGNFRNEPFA